MNKDVPKKKTLKRNEMKGALKKLSRFVNKFKMTHNVLFVCTTNLNQGSPVRCAFFFKTLTHLTLLRLVPSVTQLSY